MSSEEDVNERGGHWIDSTRVQSNTAIWGRADVKRQWKTVTNRVIFGKTGVAAGAPLWKRKKKLTIWDLGGWKKRP